MEEVKLESEPSTTKSKSNRKVWVVVSVSIVALIAFICIVSSISNESTGGSRSELNISGLSMSVDYNEYLGYSAKITGVAKNATRHNYAYASVEFSVYDSAGNNLGTAIANINNLASGDSWSFEANLFSFPNTRPTSYKLVDITVW